MLQNTHELFRCIFQTILTLYQSYISNINVAYTSGKQKVILIKLIIYTHTYRLTGEKQFQETRQAPGLKISCS